MNEGLLRTIEHILAVEPSGMAYHESAAKQFYYVIDCQRVIRELMELIPKS